MSFALALPLVASAALAAGCAEQEGAPPATAADAKKPAAKVEAKDGSEAAAKVTPAAPGHLARADVERVLRQGPPWLLRRVLPEEVIRGGKFVGWRILSLPEDWSVDLKSGDIVTKVNGLAIERPDDLWAAWMQMQSAVELRVSIERDGKPRDLVIPIDGPSAAGQLSQQLEAEPPPPARPSRWSTVVIDGSEAVPADAE
jgi:hypothetical protein